MSSFKTSNGITFAVDLRTKDVKAVRDMVKYPDGKPVDILEAAETGTLAGIYSDVSVFVDVMFLLVLDQVKNHFDLAKYDADNQKTYEFMPEQKDEPTLTKASRWFGSLIDGDALIQMVNAFNEAIVNFTPNESRRAALRAVLEKERETEILEAEYRIKLVNQMFDQTKDGLDKRWKQLTATQLTRLENALDGRFDSFTTVPESAE